MILVKAPSFAPKAPGVMPMPEIMIMEIKFSPNKHGKPLSARCRASFPASRRETTATSPYLREVLRHRACQDFQDAKCFATGCVECPEACLEKFHLQDKRTILGTKLFCCAEALSRKQCDPCCSHEHGEADWRANRSLPDECLGLEDCNLCCCIRMSKKFVLHAQQKEPNFCYAERALVMRNRHQESLKKAGMLGHASQTSWLRQNVHDKSQNLADPEDIFAFDSGDLLCTGVSLCRAWDGLSEV
ncbi:unnamed protein product [Amoebophrya sp. A120]|nr:unnamed protein product [Amoebophrya sp. A120]|eukprot:GSA120T00013581001.1